MRPKVWYNENNPKKAAMLKQLIVDGHIPKGDVDTRSITEVKAHEIKDYTQCHFFAGIGLWAYALELAGWPSNRPVWSGSCPCQDYSSAGKRKGAGGDRHLWPAWASLIRECYPPEIFGEQVASAITYGWLDTVAYDLEAENYAIAAAVLPASSVGAPHKRTDCGLWRSPLSSDGEKSGHQNLPHQVKMWPTPRKQTANATWSGRSKKVGQDLQTMAMWATPVVHEARLGYQHRHADAKGTQVSLTTEVVDSLGLGKNVTLSTVQTGNRGQLNPEFPCWLMGIPIAFLFSMQSAMQSFPKSQRSLSKRQCEKLVAGEGFEPPT